MDQIVARATSTTVRVRSPQATELAAALSGPAVTVDAVEPGLLEVHGPTAAEVGELAAARQYVLHELTSVSGSLEQAYMSLTADAVEYRSGTDTEPGRPAAAGTTVTSTPEGDR